MTSSDTANRWTTTRFALSHDDWTSFAVGLGAYVAPRRRVCD